MPVLVQNAPGLGIDIQSSGTYAGASHGRRTSRAAEASSRSASEESTASRVRASEAGIGPGPKACVAEKIRVSDRFAVMSSVHSTWSCPAGIYIGGVEKESGDLPVLVFVLLAVDPNPPNPPVFCVWLLFWPKPNPPKPDMAGANLSNRRSDLESPR